MNNCTILLSNGRHAKLDMRSGRFSVYDDAGYIGGGPLTSFCSDTTSIDTLAVDVEWVEFRASQI